jgi:hypothetical protein
MNATNLGIEYLGTYAFNNNWFLLGQFDYNNGRVQYSGTGTQSGIPQYYYNLKAGLGYDFVYKDFVLSPYAGLGYRYLSQQWGGTQTSTGAYGYDRQSTYYYIPIGLIQRFAVSQKGKIETTLEYDYFISGNQFSGLSDLNGTRGGSSYSGIPNFNNQQNSGYGVNLSVMYQQDSWAIGPYYKYWNIQQSQTNTATITRDGSSSAYNVWEPANTTVEFGLKLADRF